MTKKIIIGLLVLVAVGAAFGGGVYYEKSQADAGVARAGVPGAPAGGPMGQMTEEERARFEAMTDEERQQFMQEQMGADGARRGPGGPGGGFVSVEVIEVEADTLTVKTADGGSETYYTDEDTTVGYVKGAGELAAGSTVELFSEPEADGVTTIRAMIVH